MKTTYDLKVNFLNQCILFYKPDLLIGDTYGWGTLSGKKAGVYKMLKIMKLFCKADIQSFKMKFAVDRCLDHPKHEKAEIGSSLERVLRFWLLRGKFDGVHPELMEIGVKKIQVDKDGLTFIGEQ